VKNVCVNFIPCYCCFCMHTCALIHISLFVCAYILNISIGSTLHRGFDLPTGIRVGRFTIKSIQLAMYAKSQSDKKNLRGHIYVLLLPPRQKFKGIPWVRFAQTGSMLSFVFIRSACHQTI